MANKIIAKLILELKASGLSRNQIAAPRYMSKHSVSDVINIAKEKSIIYEKIKYLSEDEVYRMIFPDKFAVENLYERPDYEYIHRELKRVGVTLKLLWQEYQDKCKSSGLISMGYTKFCNGYADYTIVNKLTNHLENKPGVKSCLHRTMKHLESIIPQPSCLLGYASQNRKHLWKERSARSQPPLLPNSAMKCFIHFQI